MAKQHAIQYVSFYTDGSAARKITPAAPEIKTVLPQQKKQKRKVIRLDPVAILGITVALCMLIMMFVGVSALNAAREETQVMRNYVETLEQKNIRLQEDYANSYNLEEIRNTALALGMIPAQQAQEITISVTPAEPMQQQAVSAWSSIVMLLADIFA